jgi:hypothetical protein
MDIRALVSDLLLADGPDPEFKAELELYGRLVGSWDVVGSNLAPDGEVLATSRGEWHWAWALRGRAIIDVLISPPLAEHVEGEPFFEYGPTIRVYDPSMQAWRVTFNPTGSIGTTKLIARPDGDGGILMEGALPDDTPTQWRFSEISEDGFLWQERDSHDDGKTWVLAEEIRATRRS